MPPAGIKVEGRTTGQGILAGSRSWGREKKCCPLESEEKTLLHICKLPSVRFLAAFSLANFTITNVF